MTDRIIPTDARAEILRRLQTVENDNDVKIIWACESGSRAWGFASEDSDYDVRFIYLNRREWYMAVDLEDKRDVIETPLEDVWDVNGWDMRKALRLYRKSNPPLLEWLQSPIVYQQSSQATDKLRALLPTYYSPRACMYHYLHMAHKNYRTYLKGDEVWTKKYFYVLRPLLGCRWIERELGAVPMEFEHLVSETDLSDDLNDAIKQLIRDKRSGGELGRGPRVPAISDFIELEFERFENDGVVRQKPKTDVAVLNKIFHETLEEVWS